MGNFFQRVGEFVIHTSKRIAGNTKKIVKNQRFRRFLPLVAVVLIALVTFLTAMPQTGPDPEPEPPYISDDTPVVAPSEPTPEPEPEPDPVPEPEPEIEPEPDPPYTGPVDPLTGLPVEDDISASRPLAIVVNNHRAAQPQLGVSKADIIYEMPVEGGITRMLALFPQDVSEIGLIGSVRSSRLCYVDVAQSYDSIFIFAGGSDEAYAALSNRNITRLDGVHGSRTQIFYRDPNRQHMSFEHRLVTTGGRITEYLPTYDFRLEHAEGYEHSLCFAEDGVPEDGYPAMDFTVKFTSGSKTTSFSYNAEDMLYYLSQYGGTYRDGNDGTPVSVTNVLILRTAISLIPGDQYGRLKIATTGTGSGYFICGGKYIEIDWSRPDNTSQYSYTLKDGTVLNLGQGKTYICLISKTVDLEIS